MSTYETILRIINLCAENEVILVNMNQMNHMSTYENIPRTMNHTSTYKTILHNKNHISTYETILHNINPHIDIWSHNDI